MEDVPIRASQPPRRSGEHGSGKAVRSRLYVAVILANAVLLAGGAQTLTERPGWSKAQYGGPAAGDPTQGQRIAEARCAACHGADGNSTDPRYPKLAGQNPAYLYSQLRAFRNGARRSDIMRGVAATLSRSDMEDAASFFSRQTIQPDMITNQDLAAFGERIFYAGMPPCAMCHGTSGEGGMPMMGMMGRGMMGMMGSGMMANAPNLNGQHAAYITDQLHRFATGRRQAMMMGRIAASLGETERRAVAEYLSGLR